MLLPKLPASLQDRWNKMVFNVRKHSGKESKLSDFVNFIVEQAALLNNVLFSRDAFSQYNNKKKETFDRKKKMKSSLVKVDDTKGNKKMIKNLKVTLKDKVMN